MDEIEMKVHKHPLINNFGYCVDDIIACFSGTNRQFDVFMEFINTIHPNIIFTMIHRLNSVNLIRINL